MTADTGPTPGDTAAVGSALTGVGILGGGGTALAEAGVIAAEATNPIGWALLGGTALYFGLKAYQHAQQQADEQGSATPPAAVCDCPISTPADPNQEDPCKHLRSNQEEEPTDTHHGGAHGETVKPANDKKDSHHMPSADAVRRALEDDMGRNDVPAIQMQPEDHQETLSWGSGNDAKAYRDAQVDLISKGRFMEAFENDAANAREIAAEAGDPTRYDQAINEARKYAECLENNGLTSKRTGDP